jgi:hypothetical protein
LGDQSVRKFQSWNLDWISVGDSKIIGKFEKCKGDKLNFLMHLIRDSLRPLRFFASFAFPFLHPNYAGFFCIAKAAKRSAGELGFIGS